jgi:hypothetical protein
MTLTAGPRAESRRSVAEGIVLLPFTVDLDGR